MSEGPLYWSLKNSTDLRACDECGAIVQVSLVIKHTEFHLNLQRQIDELESQVSTINEFLRNRYDDYPG